jgi:hypothetical protein
MYFPTYNNIVNPQHVSIRIEDQINEVVGPPSVKQFGRVSTSHTFFVAFDVVLELYFPIKTPGIVFIWTVCFK